jgi:hypothetical protein
MISVMTISVMRPLSCWQVSLRWRSSAHLAGNHAGLGSGVFPAGRKWMVHARAGDRDDQTAERYQVEILATPLGCSPNVQRGLDVGCQAGIVLGCQPHRGGAGGGSDWVGDRHPRCLSLVPGLELM